MESSNLQVTKGFHGTFAPGEVMITDVEEALDKLIQDTPPLVRPGEFTTDQAVEKYRVAGDTASKNVVIWRLAKLVKEGKLQKRKVWMEGKRRTFFWWVK